MPPPSFCDNPKPSVLVCGGAGYIGSHMCRVLDGLGLRATVFDNLSTGHREALPLGVDFVLGDLRDPSALDALFAARSFDLVMHFSALISVAESVELPGCYWENNVVGAFHLLEAMRRHGVAAWRWWRGDRELTETVRRRDALREWLFRPDAR